MLRREKLNEGYAGARKLSRRHPHGDCLPCLADSLALSLKRAAESATARAHRQRLIYAQVRPLQIQNHSPYAVRVSRHRVLDCVLDRSDVSDLRR